MIEIRFGEDDGSAPNSGARHGSVQGQRVLKDNGEDHDSKQERTPLKSALRPRTAKTRRDEGQEGQNSTGDEGEKPGEAGAEERPEHQPLRFNLQIYNPHPPEEKKSDVEEAQRPLMEAKKGGHEDIHTEKSSTKVLSPRQDHKQATPPSTSTNQKQPTPPPERQRTPPTHEGHTEAKNPKDSRPKDHSESPKSERPSGDKNGSAATGEARERQTEHNPEASRGRSRTRSARSTATTGGAGQSRSRGASARSRSAASSRAQTPGRRPDTPDSAFTDESGVSRRPKTPLTGRICVFSVL